MGNLVSIFLQDVDAQRHEDTAKPPLVAEFRQPTETNGHILRNEHNQSRYGCAIQLEWIKQKFVLHLVEEGKHYDSKYEPEYVSDSIVGEVEVRLADETCETWYNPRQDRMYKSLHMIIFWTCAEFFLKSLKS